MTGISSPTSTSGVNATLAREVDPLYSVTDHRSDVVRRLLERGLQPRTIALVLPGFPLPEHGASDISLV